MTTVSGGPRSPWALLGCGCGALVLGASLVVVGLTTYAYRQAKTLSEGLADRQARAESTRQVLRFHEPPADLHPLGGFRIPVLFSTALLTDKTDPTPGQGEDTPADLFDREGFVYVETVGFFGKGEQIRAYFHDEGAGPAPDAENLGGQGDLEIDIAFEGREVVGRGTLPIPRGEALYLARRGRLELEGTAQEGLSTLAYLDCEADRRVRFALWFRGLEEAPAEAGGALPPGSPADPEALRELLSAFEVCP